MHVALDMTYAELLPSLYYHDEEQVVIEFTFLFIYRVPFYCDANLVDLMLLLFHFYLLFFFLSFYLFLYLEI